MQRAECSQADDGPKIKEIKMRKNTVEIMTPHHKRWKEFMKRLEGPEGCDVKPKDPSDPKRLYWSCANDYYFSRRILKAMGFNAESISASEDYFMVHRGRCNCKVLELTEV